MNDTLNLKRMKWYKTFFVCNILLFLLNISQGLAKGNDKLHDNIKDSLKSSDISASKIFRSLFAFNFSGDFTSYGSKLIYDDDYLPTLDFKYQDYYATMELYTPIVRFIGNTTLFKKNIKNTDISVNGESFSNYSYYKIDFLGLLNYNRFTRLVKNRLDSKFLKAMALWGPFYKNTQIETQSYKVNRQRYSAFVGLLTYDKSIETFYKQNNAIVQNGSCKITMESTGMIIDEFYSNLQSYYIFQSRNYPKETRKFIFIPTPSISYYKTTSTIEYYSSTQTLVQSQNFKGVGFSAGIGAIMIYNNHSTNITNRIFFYSRFMYLPWHNEGFKGVDINKEFYRNFNTDFSVNAGVIINIF